MAKNNFTAGRISGFKCPADKAQAFLWDTAAPGLGLRATPAGKPSYIFQSRFQDKTIRLTIGGPDAWSIPQAQEKARDLQRQIDDGHDPRDLKRNVLAAAAEQKKAAAAQIEADKVAAVTVAEVWAAYLIERRPHWGDLHADDHVRLSKAGGEPCKRGSRGRGLTVAGPLHPLLALPLRDLDAAKVEAWAASEAKTRPTSARLAWRLLKVFLSWCAEQPAYAGLLPAANPAKTKRSREAFGKAGVKQDALLREQLPAWFAAVRTIGNTVTAAYLQTLLLTGARPGEVLAMRWEDER